MPIGELADRQSLDPSVAPDNSEQLMLRGLVQAEFGGHP